ncbi:MAG TPA: fasciclin domain-containing protein [Armatimonadaceae bacterium]|nr:fasciclin domain-containing protein [Armatimonadaceae bacterium]
MKLRNKFLRIGVALAIAGFVATQVPVTGVTALAQDDYTDTGDDDGGDFLGINGLSNRDVIQASVLGLVAYGVASVISGNAGGAAGAVSEAAGAVVTGSPTNTLWQVLSRDARFNTYTAAAQETGLREPLDDAGAGPFLVFAPTEQAFRNLPENMSLGNLNAEQKKRLVQLHITTGRYAYGDVAKMASGTKLATLSGDFLTVTQDGPDLRVNGVPLLKENIRASNGNAIPIDTVLTPQ